jgi:glycopeptide antibiotics resistance protein
MKTLHRTILVTYLLFLLWLILFKFSFDLSSVLLGHQARSLSLVPFAGFSQGNLREMIENLVVFIPLGLLLSVNLKQVTIWRKLALIFALSLAVETLQFVLAIGVTDITDLIMNTAGGLFGLAVYDVSKKHIDTKKTDRFIIITVAILLILFTLLRVFVFRVRY